MMKTTMKTTVATITLLSLTFPVWADDRPIVRLSEPVSSDHASETFGAALDATATPVALENLLDHPTDFVGTTLRVDTRVSEVCQKKGCFYIATDGKRSVRVSFKDYAFFVPTDIGGKTVTLTGMLLERELSEADAAHFREDAGSDEIQAGTVYELVADSVRIPKT